MLLQQAKEAWESLADFRKNRNRCRDYTFGRQWNDLIKVDGHYITEYDYIMREGNVPLKNNLIRRVVRNVLGTFRKEIDGLMKVYEGELEDIAASNSLKELFCRSMEEFLISGMVVHRKGFGIRDGKFGIRTDPVSPESFFFNSSARDVRGWDIDLVGQFHEVDFKQWVGAFVNDEESYRKALEIYGRDVPKVRPFEVRPNQTIRIAEIWRHELRPRYLIHDRDGAKLVKRDSDFGVPSKSCRWILDNVWRYYFLDEEGNILLSGDSPYRHGSHPYIFKCYPFLDGEIQSFVGDMIDQQRYANRLITMYDWVVRASAKGVLMVPEGCVRPENLQDVADQWGRFNGVIVYKPQPGGEEPHQVNASNTNMGISELLEIQLKMLEDVSGVNGALQGNVSSNSVSGTLYNQQTENARTSLIDLLETYGTFITDCRDKDLALLRQCSL